MYEKSKENPILLIVVAVLLVGIFLVIALYTRTTTIIITDRYWVYTRYVKEDYTYLSTCSSSHTSCNNGKCSTTTSTHPCTKTATRTLCTQAFSSRVLGESLPEMDCTVARYGGYLQEYYQYYINYTSEGKDFSGKTIPLQLWDMLEPGTTRIVKVDVLGNIRSLGKE